MKQYTPDLKNLIEQYTPDLKSLTGLTGQQMATFLSLGMPMLEGLSSAVRLQAEFLERLEALTVQTFERQRAGCAALQELVERLRAAPGAPEAFRAQQEWLAGVMQRMTADATSWQTAGSTFLGEMRRSPSSAAPAAVPESAARRSGKASH